MAEDTNNTVTVTILNRAYHIKCHEDNAEQLLAAAEHVDTQMTRMKQPGRSSQSESVAIVTALNISHELLQTRTQAEFQIEQLLQRIGVLEKKICAALETEAETAV